MSTVDLELAHLARLDVIKLDVEGAECEVIEVAGQTIARLRPILVIEVHSHMPGRHENGTILTRQLHDLGYSFERIWTNSPTYYYIKAVPN